MSGPFPLMQIHRIAHKLNIFYSLPASVIWSRFTQFGIIHGIMKQIRDVSLSIFWSFFILNISIFCKYYSWIIELRTTLRIRLSFIFQFNWNLPPNLWIDVFWLFIQKNFFNFLLRLTRAGLQKKIFIFG